MASVLDSIRASGGAESVGFLNDIVSHLWPNINVAAGKMVKEIAEPMFEKMLPGPLKSLKFVKIDIGQTPMRLGRVDVHKTEHRGIKLDMDVSWDGDCDIELDGSMIPKFGIEHLKLSGRLSILLCPLTNTIPLIGAAQVAFINTPSLEMDFTDAANVADCSLIDRSVRKVILSIVSSMAVLPNRFLVKLDSAGDYFKTYQHQFGILRIVVEKATDICPPKEGGGFFSNLVKDVPDCYCKVTFGGDEWKTTTKKNSHDPSWNESHDFILSDLDQEVAVDVQDDDLAGDDDIGLCSITSKQILLTGGRKELCLVHKGKKTTATLTLGAQLFKFVPDIASFTSKENTGDGKFCGLVTILVAGAMGIQGDRCELRPCVKVAWGEKCFSTATKTDCPGTDISNPSFDTAFRIPVTAELAKDPQDFKISLIDGCKEVGSRDIAFNNVIEAPDMVLADNFDVGLGATVRASICIRGVQKAE